MKTFVNTFLPIFQVFVKVYPVIKLDHLTFLRKELAIYWGKMFLGSRLSGHLCSDYSEILLKTYAQDICNNLLVGNNGYCNNNVYVFHYFVFMFAR